MSEGGRQPAFPPGPEGNDPLGLRGTFAVSVGRVSRGLVSAHTLRPSQELGAASGGPGPDGASDGSPSSS